MFPKHLCFQNTCTWSGPRFATCWLCLTRGCDTITLSFKFFWNIFITGSTMYMILIVKYKLYFVWIKQMIYQSGDHIYFLNWQRRPLNIFVRHLLMVSFVQGKDIHCTLGNFITFQSKRFFLQIVVMKIPLMKSEKTLFNILHTTKNYYRPIPIP